MLGDRPRVRPTDDRSGDLAQATVVAGRNKGKIKGDTHCYHLIIIIIIEYNQNDLKTNCKYGYVFRLLGGQLLRERRKQKDVCG